MDGPTVNRRQVLAGMGAALSGLSGCAGVASVAVERPDPVSILAAGSLNNALENGLRTQIENLQVEAHGSAEIARLVADGAKDPDIVSVADVALFDAPLRPAWYAEFATNALVVVYNPDTPGGRRFEQVDADEWFRPLLDEDVSLGRTDPDLDPLGYRTLFALELASDHYGLKRNLRAQVPKRDQLYPETQLVSQFETGSIDVAITYRNMAVERDYDYIELPPEVDLSTARFADEYAKVTYELPDGKVVRGAPIRYGSTVRNPTQAVLDVFEQHVGDDYLEAFGFVVPDDYPRYRGDAPDTRTN